MVNPQEIYAYLIQKGADPNEALGILANIKQESNFNPEAINAPEGAYGLFQHRLDRKTGLQNQYGANPSWKQQIDYALNEPEGKQYLRGNYADPAAATNQFMRTFERPAQPDKETAWRTAHLPDIQRQIDPRMAGNMAGAPAVDPRSLPQRADAPGSSPSGQGSLLQDPRVLAQLGLLPMAGQGPPQRPGQEEGWSDYRAFTNPWTQMGAAMMASSKGGNSALGKGLLVAGQAVTEQEKLNLEMNKAAMKGQGGADLPENIKEMMILKAMNPNMSDEQIMSMAFAGRVPMGGARIEKVGERLFNVSHNEFGHPTYTPISEAQQKEYEDTIGSQEKVKKVAETFGKAQVDTLINVSSEYQKVANGKQATSELLDRFESGEFDDATGPLAGRIGQFFNPETATVMAKEMNQALANLGIQNLAPVSNYEIDLIKKMYASSFQTKEQNIAVLKDLKKVQDAKEKVLKTTLERLKTESIEEYLQKPEVLPEFTAAAVPVAGAPGAASSTKGYAPEKAYDEAISILKAK